MTNVREKIPLLVNGSLPDDERDALLADIENDKSLQDEMTFLSSLREGLRNQPEEMPNDLVLARVKKSIREEQRKPTSHWWRTGAVAACALLALQSAFLVNTLPGGSDMPGSDVQLLDGGSVAIDLQVIFAADTTVTQIQTALNAIDAEVVSGPSALGLFGLHLSGGATSEQAMLSLSNFNFVEEVIEIEPNR